MRLAALPFALALGVGGCLAATSPVDDEPDTIAHPIPVGPAVERDEPSTVVAGAQKRERLSLPDVAAPETLATGALGPSSPSTQR